MKTAKKKPFFSFLGNRAAPSPPSEDNPFRHDPTLGRLSPDTTHQAGRMALLLLLEAPAAKMGVILREILDRSKPIEERERLVRLAYDQTADGGNCPADQRESIFSLLCGPLHGPPLVEWLRSNTSGTLDTYLFKEGETNGRISEFDGRTRR